MLELDSLITNEIQQCYKKGVKKYWALESYLKVKSFRSISTFSTLHEMSVCVDSTDCRTNKEKHLDRH